jgi:Holliday junction DNA helicase RuvA
MIARIDGTLIVKTPETVVIDVGGVGYELSIPLSTYYTLPDIGEQTVLNVSTFMREDAIQLYGFATADEKTFFTMLLTISGVGPKLARGILSGAEVSMLVSAIASNDIAALTRLPGVGKKTAERITLELKDKVTELSAAASHGSMPPGEGVIGGVEGGISSDVVSALKNLGYKDSSAEDAVREILSETDEDGSALELAFDDMLRRALKLLAAT